MKEKIIENKQIIMLVLSILLIIIGATYAWFTWVSKDNTNLNLTIGEIAEIVYTNGDTISATNIGPVLDINDGEATSFSFKKRASEPLKTYIYITPTTLPDELKEESFKIALLKSSDGASYTKVIETSTVDKTLDTEFLLGTDFSELSITYYKVVIYIDGKMENPNTMMGKSFVATIRVDAEIIPIASEECFVFDEGTQTITDYNPIESYDIHPQCVANAQTNLGITEEEATTFCSGGEFQGYTIDGYIAMGAVADLEGAGIITNVVYSACPVDVVIPSSINEVSVTSIGDSAFDSNNLTSVVIPDSVTTIGNYAFRYNNLTSVVIPDSVTTIGEGAFSGNNLTSVVIPDSVTAIGYEAFDRNNLTSVTIGNSVTRIGDYAFSGNNLTSVVIPNGVTTIGMGAFRVNNLTSVVIPDSVTSIGEGAFNNNQLPESQAYIYARNGNGSIDYTTIVSYGGAKRDNVVIPNNVTTIGDLAFAENNLTSVIIPDSVTTIGDGAFEYNTLTSVVISNGVTTIGKRAFAYNNLTSVVISNGVTSIGGYAFSYNNLTSVVIPNSVTTIGSSAFSYNNLSSVYIGANSNLTETTGIGGYAFTSSNRTSTSNGTTYVDNPNLTTIYNNSGKKFKWYYVTQGRNNSTSSTYNFITGTVPSYNSYNEVTITTGGTT